MIVAIDPGPEKSAYVAWDSDASRVAECGWIDNAPLRSFLREYCAAKRGGVAIEMIASYGMAVGADVFRTCVEIGRFVEVAEREGVFPHLVFRKDVKLFLCGTPRAKDANIRQALIDLYGAPGTKKNPGALHGVKSHAWAALAVAVTVSDYEDGPDPVRDGWVGKDGLP